MFKDGIDSLYPCCILPCIQLEFQSVFEIYSIYFISLNNSAPN